MPIPSVTVSFSDIQTEFGGGNPISLSEYYGLSASVTLPTNSQPINVGIFRGVTASGLALGYGRIINAEVVNTNVFKFTLNGTLQLIDSGRFDILVVGGGGGGGPCRGGGGGGGGVVYHVNIRLNTGTYTITIGGAGNGGDFNINGSRGFNGGNTDITFNSTLLYQGIGGGGGGCGVGGDGGSYGYRGGDGGSGGGAGGNPNFTTSGGSSTQGSTFWNGSTYIKGGANGNNNLYNPYAPGNGGGGNGGGGFSVNITGTDEYYGGGGGGGTRYGDGGLGSIYGGGGGAGGAIDGNGLSGSSGVVIFKYLGA